jgi:tRNA U34 2-thiouridine synthase MnmA/TrmU
VHHNRCGARSLIYSLPLVQVCEQAGVALQVVPLTEAYWKRVVSHSITEIKAGRTPNPDIMCNSRCASVVKRACNVEQM